MATSLVKTAAVAVLFALPLADAAQPMLFSKFDEYGTNANPNEILLTPQTVGQGSAFGQKWHTTTDGGAYLLP